MRNKVKFIDQYFKRWIAVGGDKGSLQVANAISSYVSCSQLSLDMYGIHSANHFVYYLKNNNILGLFCSTSQSDDGFQFEKNLRIAAFQLKLPIICIEDFPGNYKDVNEAETSILIVDNEFSLSLYKKRGVKVSNYLIFPSVRYDHIRFSLVEANNELLHPVVLWAGQPEFQYNFNSLKYIAPKLKELSLTLMFRAHPCDSEYHKGAYAEYFDELKLSWVDVTNKSIDCTFFKNITLVITQFSSLAIEAGFYGVPTVNVLFQDVGRKLLLEKTGHAELMTVKNAAAFLICDQRSLGFLDFFLRDVPRRAEIIKNFKCLYKTNEKQLPKLLTAIKDIISRDIN